MPKSQINYNAWWSNKCDKYLLKNQESKSWFFTRLSPAQTILNKKLSLPLSMNYINKIGTIYIYTL